MSPSREWQALLSAPRHANATLSLADIPMSPGVYAWLQDGECVYVGKATSLRRRLSTHRSHSLELSHSILRASVAVKVLCVTRSEARRKPSVMTSEQIAVIDRWFSTAEVSWIESETREEAEDLEHRLLSEYKPPLNLM